MSNTGKLILIFFTSFVIGGILFIYIKFLKGLNEAFPDSEKIEKKTVCECVEWGKNFDVLKESELMDKGTSEEMKKFEDEKEKWSSACHDLLNPTKMSGIKKLQEELEKCK
ncbi:MAG: hypothetical protein RIQ90_1166 [Bacteroidota bacterium]|jgi:hypothetical protein